MATRSPTAEERFFTRERRTDNPALKAALLSSSFEYWRDQKNPYPIYLPPSLKSPLPPPAHELPALLRRYDGTPGHHYVHGCIGRGLARLARCAHNKSKYGAIVDQMPRRVPLSEPPPVSTEARGSFREPFVMHPDIAFDADSQITKITVWSRFDNIHPAEAADIVDMAQPLNWAHAVPNFFRRSDPVRFDKSTGKLARDPQIVPQFTSSDLDAPGSEATERARAYQLQEFVEWAWTPSLSGGIINVLAIEEFARDDEALLDFVEAVNEQTNSAPGQGDLDPAISIHYSYSLVRSLQSKFVSNWELGGLDVDEGHYAAVWDRNSRSLFIEAQKSIRYSNRADIFQGFSSILNLLAPAVTSMLMKHLAYEGVLQYLESKRADLSALPANDARRGALPNDPITGLFTAVS